MNYVVDLLTETALSLEKDALKWEQRSSSSKGLAGDALINKANEISQDKWKKVHELWRAIHIIEKYKGADT